MQLGAFSTRLLLCFLVGSAALHAQAGMDVALVEEAAARRVADFGLPDVELFLRVGRPVPPGLTATRARERETGRAEATALLADELAPGAPRREAWLAALSDLLTRGGAGAEIWSVAAATVAELGLYELDDRLIAGLAPDASPIVRHAAVEALRRLYGVRPIRGQAFEPPFEPSPGTAYLLSVLRAREARDLANRSAVLASDPERALEALADPDPAVRAQAARVAGNAVAAGTLDAARVRPLLLERLQGEVAPEPFGAGLEALLVLTVGRAPDAPEVAAVRSLLLRLSGEAPDVLLLSIAHGLARLPWEVGPARPEANLRAAARQVAKLLGRVAADPHADQDVTAGILRAQEELFALVDSASRPDGATETGGWVRGSEARAPLLRLLESDRASEGVRRASAETLGRVALAEDVPRLLDVLADERSGPGLRYALLGTLGALAESAGGDAGPIVGTLLAHLDDPDADLRRRALALLSSPRLDAALAGRDLAPLLARLERETVRELRLGLLSVLRRHGDAAMLESLLASASFDVLASGDPQAVRALAETVAALAGEDPSALLRSARRLGAVNEPTGGVARLVRCLDLVLLLGDAEARALEVSDHDRIVSWARRVRSGGASFADAVSNPALLLERLVAVHLPALAEVGVPSEAERTHTRALFLGDLAALGQEGREEPAFESYAHALELAETSGEVFLAARVRRDRARFALDRGHGAHALADLRELAASPDAVGVLELSDLRRLAGLIVSPAARTGPAAAGSLADAESFEVLRTLVAREGWRAEPDAVRLRDLTNLAERALATADPERLRLARALLAGVPDVELAEAPSVSEGDPDVPNGDGGAGGTNGDGSTEPTPDSRSPATPGGPIPTWAGLERDPESRAVLVELRARLDAALPPRAAPAAKEAADTADPDRDATGGSRPRAGVRTTGR